MIKDHNAKAMDALHATLQTLDILVDSITAVPKEILPPQVLLLTSLTLCRP
jgi:hypothetical protein